MQHPISGNRFGKPARSFFGLAEGIAHLNHGSYGATPREVIAAQRAYQDELESEPSGFMQNRFPVLMRRAAEALGSYLKTRADQIALIENATSGVNAVLQSLALEPGDEILITDQTYGAVRNTVMHACARTGARLVDIRLPFPDPSDDAIVSAFATGLSARTKLAIIDHVTSPTALILPIARMAAEARGTKARILIDGAHAPGMFALDLSRIGCDYYTGNCHKWLCAPKGSGFLWTREAYLRETHPTVISHGYGQGYEAEFDWTGTRDASAQFALPDALAFLDRLGAADIMEHNRDLALRAAEMLADTWNTRIGADRDHTGSMAMIELPIAGPASREGALETRAVLLERHGIQVPINAIDNHYWARISAQIYNEIEDYERLATAVRSLNA
jgi:isopenicillin-N epimerase